MLVVSPPQQAHIVRKHTGCVSLPEPKSLSFFLEVLTSCLLLVFQQLLCPLKVPEAFSVNHFGGGPGSAHCPRGAPGSGCPCGSSWGASGACSSSSHSHGPHCRAHPPAVPTGRALAWCGCFAVTLDHWYREKFSLPVGKCFMN